MAASLASKHQVWLQNALSELGYPDIPSALFGDNNGSLDSLENPRISDWSKHIDIQYHYVWELIKKGILTFIHIPSKCNPADICTKALPGPRFSYL